jgi:hypothetical protein
MSDTEEVKLAKLESAREFMAKEISEIKSDVKELRKDFDSFRTDVKVTFAKYSVGISLVIGIIQFVIEKVISK